MVPRRCFLLSLNILACASSSRMARCATPLSTPALISWLIPPIILLAQVGQIPAEWMFVRVVGVALSLYAMVMMPWATRVLGRSYAPGPDVLQEHALVSSGPFRLVRHPIYSAVAARWLGAALELWGRP
jgi:protein-S-isoprenylcysteine O-methyltransferase Ste14